MKKFVLAAAFAVAAAVPAQADLLDYAELFGGATFSPDLEFAGADRDLETGYNVGGSFGWWLGPQFALEMDFFFTSSDYDLAAPDEGTLESFTFMGNAIYNFADIGSGFRPYVGAGVGGAQLRVSDGVLGGLPFIGDSEIVFAWQALAGVAINVDQNIEFIAEYRYQSASDADVTLTFVGGPMPTDIEYASHSLTAGFRFNIN